MNSQSKTVGFLLHIDSYSNALTKMSISSHGMIVCVIRMHITEVIVNAPIIDTYINHDSLATSGQNSPPACKSLVEC